MRLALAILPMLATPALADAVTYRGTIGTREAIIELTEPADGAVVGRFAFLDEGKSVPLTWQSDADNSFILNEEGRCTAELCSFNDEGVASGVPTVAQWELRLDSTTLTGTRKGSGKTKLQSITAEEIGRRHFAGDALPVTLRDNIIEAVFAYDVPVDAAKAPYEMALVDVPLTERSRFLLDGTVVTMMVDPRTKFAFPRVAAFADGSSTDAINAILDNQHAAMSISALDCLANGYIGFGANQYSYEYSSLGDYDSEQVALSYASPKLVSWAESGSLWCGGAHPYNHIDSSTYDVAKGEPLDLSILFKGWVVREYGAENGSQLDLATARANPDDYDWYPDDQLIAFVRERIPAELFSGDAEQDQFCLGEDAIRSQLDIRFEPGPNAVFTLSGFPHVMSVCNGDLFSIALDELGDILTPEAMDFFD